MANEHPSENNKTPAQDSVELPAAPSLSAKGAARRRFARVGAGATGVLATLYSQPGMACTYCGLKPSGAVSAMDQHKTAAQLSHAPACTEGGYKPSVWAGIVPSTVVFGDYFTCTRIDFSKVRAVDILNAAQPLQCYDKVRNKTYPCTTSYTSNDLKVAQYLAAAMGNYTQGRVKALSADILQDIWNQWSASQSYRPVAGRTWNVVDIIGYISGTMD